MAHTHHDAATYHQRRAGKSELLGAQQRGDHHVAAGLELPVALHDDAIAQAVFHQRLLGLGDTELPWRASVLDRGERRGAGATVVARDQNNVALGFGDASRDGTHTHLRHQLDVHPRARVGVLQIVDELLDVFDRIDVVVRRRADQTHARCGVPRASDPRVHLVAGQLAPLARLGALGHLDLQVIRINQIFGRDAKPP